MKIAICDDQQLFREQVQEYIERYKGNYVNIHVEQFSCGEDLLNIYENGDRFDVIFLDIEMNSLNGIDTAKSIRQHDLDVLMVFVSGHKDYVFNVFACDTFDFITKPVDEMEFKRVLTRVISRYNGFREHINFVTKERTVAMLMKDIVCVEGYQRRTIIYTKSDRYEFFGKLQEVENRFLRNHFLRCHQGFMVNMVYIRCIEDSFILTTTGMRVPMSVRKKRECISIFHEFVERYHL